MPREEHEDDYNDASDIFAGGFLAGAFVVSTFVALVLFLVWKGTGGGS